MTVTYSASVAGSWIDGAAVITGGAPHQVINPATGDVVAECALATPADVDTAVAVGPRGAAGLGDARPRPTGRRCWPSWPSWPPSTPTRWSPRRSARPASRCGWPREFDVPGSVDNIDFFAGAARHLEGKATAEYSGDHTSSIRREAIGVVATITPWNYPLQMAVWKVLPALAAGCTRGHQTRRADAADHADAGAAGHRGGPARRRLQRRHRRGRRRRHRAGRTPRRRRGDVHRVDARGPQGDGRRGACTATAPSSSSAARRRSWCSTTPTWTPRSRARSPVR